MERLKIGGEEWRKSTDRCRESEAAHEDLPWLVITLPPAEPAGVLHSTNLGRKVDQHQKATGDTGPEAGTELCDGCDERRTLQF